MHKGGAQMGIMDIVKLCYSKTVSGNRYDLKGATEHNMAMAEQHVLAEDMPKIESDFIDANHYGCCLHYGFSLFQKLHNNGIPCFICISLEENEAGEKVDNHVSVLYIVDGKRLIADPVETVKRDGKGEFLNIPIEQFRASEGTLWLYDPYGEHRKEEFFTSFLKYPIEVLL